MGGAEVRTAVRLMMVGRALRRAPGRPIAHVNVEPVDLDVLLGEAVAERGEVVQEHGPGGVGFDLESGGHRPVAHGHLQAEGTEVGGIETEAEAPAPVAHRLERPSYPLDKTHSAGRVGPGRIRCPRIGGPRRALIAPGAGRGAGFAFAVSLGEFGATSFLVRSGSPTLPVAIEQLLGRPGAVNAGQAYALAVLLMLVTAVALLVVDHFRTGTKADF